MIYTNRQFVPSILCSCLCFALCSLFSGEVSADVVKLKSGGELRGKIDWKKSRPGSATISINTLTGATVVVDRDTVEFAIRRPEKIEHYETRARRTLHTVAAQWELAEWCREQNLKLQRAVHLEKIIELEPEHKKAHQGLGHIRHNNTWTTRDELMIAQGYVKYKSRYITPQELELIQKNKAELEKERVWFKSVRMWFGWMNGRNLKRQRTGYTELKNIKDPNAVAALKHLMSDHQQKDVRRFYIDILSQMNGPRPVPALVSSSLFDIDYELRYYSLNTLTTDQFDAAVPYYVRELKNKSNPIVRRAALGLGRVGNDQVVPYLIDALVTTHTYKMRVPKKGTSLSTNGTGGGGTPLPPNIEGMLRTGQFPNGVIINNQDMVPNQLRPMKTITIKYNHKNKEVLTALQKLTSKSFSYDERTWRLWWTSQKKGLVK